MKFFTKNLESNHLAKIVRLPPPVKHPNADKLQLVTIDNQTVVTGLTAKEDDIYIYFPLETAINAQFLSATNSFSDSTLNKDSNVKGFFTDKCRVKAIKLRGIPSEGYIIPIDSLLNWARQSPSKKEIDELIGKEFDSIEWTVSEEGLDYHHTQFICQKYIPATNKKPSSNKPKQQKKPVVSKIVPGQFHFHVKTGHLKKNIDLINPTDIITISEKLHGTSLVVSKLLVRRQLKWYEKILKKLGVKIQDTHYDMIYSSRNVIKNDIDTSKIHNHYYKADIWKHAADRIYPFLKPGMTAYAEIVGFTPEGKAIQKSYDYGCKEKEFDTYIYRMTTTDVEGNVLELTTNQIKRFVDNTFYSNKEGKFLSDYPLKMVPIHYHGQANHYHAIGNHSGMLDSWRTYFLKKLTENYLEKPCKMCKNNVTAEGIVLTVEADQFFAYKLKSWGFLEYETKLLDTGEVDIETEQTITKEPNET